MTKRTGNAGATQVGSGTGGALAEALTPLIAGMTATRTHLLEWVHTLGVGVLHAVFRAEPEALAGPKGKHQVERTLAKRQAAYIALHRIPHAQFARVMQPVAAEIQWHHRPPAFALQQVRKVTGATPRFQRPSHSAPCQMWLQHAEQNRPHAAVPPEVFLGLADVGKLRRIHQAAHWPDTGLTLLSRKRLSAADKRR